MAITRNFAGPDDGNTITQTYSWTSEAGNDHLDATDFLTPEDDVDRFKIMKIWVTSHLSHEGTNFADNAYGIYLLDSNNVPIVFLDRTSDGKYDFSYFDGYDTKDFSDSATGGLKIAMGHTYRHSTGTVDANSNVTIGCGFTITVKAVRIYK